MTMAFYPDPTTVPPLGIPKSNTFVQYTYTTEYILNYEINIYTFSPNNQLLVNTLIYAQKNSLSSLPLLKLQYTLLITTIYPATTHLSQVTLYNPVTQQKVVTYVNNCRCFANYFIAHSTSANFYRSLRKRHTIPD